MAVAAIPRARLASAAAGVLNEIPSIEPRLRGLDPDLLSIIRELILGALPYSGDRLAWQSLGDKLVNHFLASYGTSDQPSGRGALERPIVAAINRVIETHLEGEYRWTSWLLWQGRPPHNSHASFAAHLE